MEALRADAEKKDQIIIAIRNEIERKGKQIQERVRPPLETSLQRTLNNDNIRTRQLTS